MEWRPNASPHEAKNITNFRLDILLESQPHVSLASRKADEGAFKAPSSAFLISRYVLRLGQRGRCCFSAACLNRKMYLGIRNTDEAIFCCT